MGTADNIVCATEAHTLTCYYLQIFLWIHPLLTVIYQMERHLNTITVVDSIRSTRLD